MVSGEKPGQVVTHGGDVAIFYDHCNRCNMSFEDALIDGTANIRS